jgi:hypothetical protein
MILDETKSGLTVYGLLPRIDNAHAASPELVDGTGDA